jgi:nucleoside-diphosphate-sugar epimerase
MSQLHVVFGAGPIGLATVDELVARDLPVRIVSRSGRATAPSGVEVVAADAADAASATRAAKGAAVVYQCLNPEYHRWAEDFPPLQAGVVGACRAHGARLVSFENVYMYGNTCGAPITEDTPTRPHTRKGKVRLAMAEELRSLHAAGQLDVTTARSSDYFGPGAREQSPLGELLIGKALARKSAQVVGDPNQLHSYTYIPDAGRTMAELGTRDDVSGEIFHVPNAPARSTREIADIVGRQIGATVELQVAPKLLLRVMGLFNKSIGEVIEMLYEFEQPFVVDSTKAEQRLGLSPTPLEEALATTIGWFRATASAREVTARRFARGDLLDALDRLPDGRD